MVKRHLPALVVAAAVSGCSVAETPEQCVERFEEFFADSRPDLRDARLQPIFTYNITHMENALETLAGDSEKRAGMRMTLAAGASGTALDAFYRADVPPKGALFAADGFSLYRVKGAPGTRDEAIVAGCRGAPAKAPLTRIDWIALPPRTEDMARTQ
jgi:hypothetical protein